jgi:formimidoylglutamate deiminase
MLVLEPEWVLTEEGLRTGICVEVDSNRIVGLKSTERHPETVVRLPGKLLLPGFVNAHSHAFQRAFRGRVQWKPAGRDDFWSWRDRMYAVANGLSEEGVFAVSRLAFLEMAEAGITQVGEFHYLHHRPDGSRYADPDALARRVIDAALDVGIRICLLRVAYARKGADGGLRDNQRRFGDRSPLEALEAVERLRDIADSRVTLGLAPHSVRALSAEGLSALAGSEGPVHAHVSEQPAEIEGSYAEHGKSPLAVLADAGLVNERFVAVHLTHPEPVDLDILDAAGAAICVCPSTELDLGDGFLPVEARTGRLCLGTDSHAEIDMLAEARSLELHARALAGRRNVLSPVGEKDGLARVLLDAASRHGGAALGAEGRGIGVGALADLVALDLRRTAAFGVPPLQAAVFNGTPDWVSDVWVGGVPVVRDGVHPRRSEILEAARRHL